MALPSDYFSRINDYHVYSFYSLTKTVSKSGISDSIRIFEYNKLSGEFEHLYFDNFSIVDSPVKIKLSIQEVKDIDASCPCKTFTDTLPIDYAAALFEDGKSAKIQFLSIDIDTILAMRKSWNMQEAKAINNL